MGYGYFSTVLNLLKQSRRGQDAIFAIPGKKTRDEVIKIKCAKFEPNRSTGNVFNIGGTKTTKNTSFCKNQFSQKFQKPQRMFQGNVVKNQCVKFEPNQSTGNVFNFGGTKTSGDGGGEEESFQTQKIAYFEQLKIRTNTNILIPSSATSLSL